MANKKQYVEDCGGLKPYTLTKPKKSNDKTTTSKPKTTKKPKRK